MSLRRRLLAGCVAIALVLMVADLALASTFRSYLVGRIDRQLTTASRSTPADRGPGPGPGPGRGDDALTEYFLGIADGSGTLTFRIGRGFRELSPPLPAPAKIVARAADPGQELRPFDARSADGTEWRVAAVRLGGGEYLVVGIQLADTTETLHRMLWVLALATLAVLLTLLLVGIWVLRQGVRPLTAMTATAGAIADGALSERVEHTDERTEAGRLGVAMNTMLGRIETAFAAREASEQRLRRFIADASHELRTPLTSIRGYAELYRQGALTDPALLDDAMRRVEDEAERMGELVDDMLLLARLDQGRPLETEPVRLDLIAVDAVTDARAVDPDRAVTLDAVEVVVLGDESRLRQVASNLVGNALRHTSPGTPVRVIVSITERTALLEVADDGPGLDEETAARVFERFFRADPARMHDGGGSGLGLSIVQAVVVAHGGRAWIDTAPGAGTRFYVELPLDVAAE